MSVLPRHPHRTATVASVAALALGLPLVATTVLAGPASSADPVEDCVAAFPVADLVAGQEVDGLTVVQGTTPTSFTGEVLGVLEDGIAPDLDMIMVDLDMPTFARTGGIWQGMSGSPVYVEDGGERRLLGAVSYGLSFGPSPIAGVTPYEEMDDHLATPAAPAPRVALQGATARAVAARAGISTRQAQQGFRELPMPLGISGITARSLDRLRSSGARFLAKDSYVLGRASATAVGAETIVAGGNMAASVAYGDVAMAGVGTATSVCDGRVVGFGHPMALLGATTEALHPADAVYVQPDSLGAPFKVANLGPVVGTVSDDRLAGLTGSFGAAPKAAAVTSTLTYGARTRTGSTAVSVADFLAEATSVQVMANHDRVVDGPAEGTELQTWAITGTEDGTPFTLTHTDRRTSSTLSYELPLELGALVWGLSEIEGVEITSVSTTGTLTDDLRRHTVSGVQQLRGGKWVAVTKKKPATAKAGRTLKLRVLLGGSAGQQIVALAPVKLPKKAAGRLVLAVQGGDGLWSSAGGATIAQVRTSIAGLQRHDTVRVQVGTPDRIDLGVQDEESELDMLMLGRVGKPARFVRAQTTAPAAHVISGRRMLRVVVTR
jgi:hypothetical protein